MGGDGTDAAALKEAAEGFFLAAEHGRSDVIKALADHADGRLDLSHVVDPVTGRSPLHVAVQHRKLDALRVLLAAGFPPDTRCSTSQRTPFELAVESKVQDLLFVFHQFAIQQLAADDHKALDRLLRAGVPIDLTDGPERNTLAHWAITCRAIRSLAFLLDHESAKVVRLVNLANADGATPLHIACRDGFIDGVRVLLQHNADPRCTGTGGFCKDKRPVELVTSTEVRELLNQQEERQMVAKGQAAQCTTEIAEKLTEPRSARRPAEEEMAAIHRKYALELEEKDLLIRQLRTTIETLVIESQEIRKLGEERTVLDYVRKLREEKDIVRRQLEDSEDHIRTQQQQIQELKAQIREMATLQAITDSQPPPPPHNLQQSERNDERNRGCEPASKAPILRIDTSVKRGSRQQSAATPETSVIPWGGVWDVLWGSDISADAIEADGEVIMTV